MYCGYLADFNCPCFDELGVQLLDGQVGQIHVDIRDARPFVISEIFANCRVNFRLVRFLSMHKTCALGARSLERAKLPVPHAKSTKYSGFAGVLVGVVSTSG